MMRYLKVLFSVMVAIGFMASGAWAGDVVANNGTAATVALEAMGTARNLTFTGPANNAISLTTSRTLISGDLINFTFTNVGTIGGPVYLCETGNDTVMDALNLAANSTAFTLRANRSVTSGAKMFLSTNNLSSGSGCNTANIGQVIVRVPAMTSAALATVAFNVTSFGTLMDSASAKTLANISKQFATAYASAASTIDFVTVGANGMKFTGTPAATTANPGQANINYTAKDIDSVGSGLTVSAILGLQDSTGIWQGIQRVYVNGDGACNFTTSNASNNAVNASSGTINLAIVGTAFNGTASYTGNVCADVKGNVVLQSRTITGAYDISVTGTGANDPAADSFTTLMIWTPNGYQGIIPYVTGLSTYRTICMINNKSILAASVTADILTSESGASLSGLAGISIGSLAGLGTMRVDFDSAITPYTYSGGIETAGTPISLTGLQANDRYSVMINIGASPTQITINCVQLDPLGSKRMVPVMTQIGTTNPWQQ